MPRIALRAAHTLPRRESLGKRGRRGSWVEYLRGRRWRAAKTTDSGGAGEARGEARDENKTERAIAAAEMDASHKQQSLTAHEGASVSRAFEHTTSFMV